jgi:hypothetical protein
MTLLEKLKAALKLKGLSEGLADLINITSEDQIEGILTQLSSTQNSDELDFSKVLSSNEFNAYVQKNGFDSLLKNSKTLQSEHDKKVSSGIKTFKEKYFKDMDPEGAEGHEDGKGKEGMQNQNDAPEWAKALISKVENLEKEKASTGKLSQAKDLFTKSVTLQKLPEKLQNSWLNRINLESETSFEDQIKALEEEVTEFKIVTVNSKGLPIGGGSADKPSDSEVNDIVDAIV